MFFLACRYCEGRPSAPHQIGLRRPELHTIVLGVFSLSRYIYTYIHTYICIHTSIHSILTISRQARTPGGLRLLNPHLYIHTYVRSLSIISIFESSIRESQIRAN